VLSSPHEAALYALFSLPFTVTVAAIAWLIVRTGVVELWGTITDERERRALIVAAENVPGVKEI
jgi:hypothetical protein